MESASAGSSLHKHQSHLGWDALGRKTDSTSLNNKELIISNDKKSEVGSF